MVVKKEKAVREMKRTMKKVRIADRAAVIEAIGSHSKGLEKDTPAGGERQPGQVVDGVKVSFTYKWYCEHFPIVSFMPEETVLLTEQGVSVQAISGVLMHVPEPFQRNYERHRAELRKGDRALPTDRGYINEIGLGAGGLEPEITVKSET